MNRKKVQLLEKKRPKNKIKRKKWRRHYLQLKKKQGNRLKTAILLFIFAIMCSGAAGYSRYYQMTNLNKQDGDIIIQTYFLVDAIEEELKKIENGADSQKSQEKLQNMISLLVSYSSNTPSASLSFKGQKLLKRYYVSSKELGVNLNSQSTGALTKEKSSEYLSDIEKIKQQQQTVFKTFDVNQSALKQKKQ